MSNEDALSLDKVSKFFGAYQAVRQVSMAVGEGEFVTLLGPSGSGKSTLLNLILGASRPDSGRLTFRGKDTLNVPLHKRNIGMVFQRYTLFPNKTVRDNIAFPLQIRRLEREKINQKVNSIVELVGLSALSSRYPSEISGGQAQRVALARALVFDPALMLMDEPLGALDKSLRDNLQEEIGRLQRETKVPTLYVTHDQDEAMNLSDRIIVMSRGEVVAAGRPRDLYEMPPSLWVAQFLGEANVFKLRETGPAMGETIHVCTTGGAKFVARCPKQYCGTGEWVAILRPERCKLTRVIGPSFDGLEAQVERCTYLGSRQRVHLRLRDNEAIIASLPGTEIFQPGESVGCYWNEGDAWLTTTSQPALPEA